MAKRTLPKAVIFDWNGTLNDMDVIKEQDIYVGREVFGVDLTAEDVRKSWGRPAEELLPMLFGRGGDKRSWQEMRDIFWSCKRYAHTGRVAGWRGAARSSYQRLAPVTCFYRPTHLEIVLRHGQGVYCNHDHYVRRI